MNEKALDNKCPSCGAPLLFKPKSNKWECDHCKSSFTLEELKKFNNASSDENNKKEEVKDEPKAVKKEVKDNTVYVTYNCKNCGAEIIADEQTASTFCVYCGNTAILKSKLSGKFSPSKIIPFKKEKEDAIEAFKSISKGRPLMPKFFNDPKNIEKISGVYIPFWLYDINVDGSIIVKCTNVSSWRSGNMTYVKTDIYHEHREGSINYNRIPVDGSTRFPDDIMNSIEPFNYDEMVDYNHAYLSGFLAEKYNVEGEEPLKIASDRAVNSTRNAFLGDVPMYNSKHIIAEELTPTKKNLEYVLLPVWMVTIKFNNKYYTFAQNAQTGEFVGNIPIDAKRVVLYSILVFIISVIVAFLLSLAFFYFGGN